jgi:hypothetical protein
MKNLSKTTSILVIFLAGCSTAQVPYTQNHPTTYQKVARATSHWDILADDVATQTLAKIGTQKTIYIAEPREDTEFNRAFHNFLITQMVNKGIPVSDTKLSSIEVHYDTQIVTHNSERRAYKPGTLTLLAAGLMVAYNVPHWTNGTDKGVAFLGAAAGVDAAVSMDAGSPTKTELVVTTSAIEEGRYLMRKTDIYYIETKDLPLFMHVEQPGTQLKNFSVVGEK